MTNTKKPVSLEDLTLQRVLMATLADVNLRCLEIVSEISSNGRIATPDFVVRILLQRYCVREFRDLRVGDICDTPALFLLIEIHQKV